MLVWVDGFWSAADYYTAGISGCCFVRTTASGRWRFFLEITLPPQHVIADQFVRIWKIGEAVSVKFDAAVKSGNRELRLTNTGNTVRGSPVEVAAFKSGQVSCYHRLHFGRWFSTTTHSPSEVLAVGWMTEWPLGCIHSGQVIGMLKTYFGVPAKPEIEHPHEHGSNTVNRGENRSALDTNPVSRQSPHFGGNLFTAASLFWFSWRVSTVQVRQAHS